jgi:protein tyrosine/serine phosphatase
MRSLAEVLYNFHWIVPDEAARSAQAWAGFLGPFLKAHNIATLINLRGANPHWDWWLNETRTCRKRGVLHRDLPINSRRLPSRAQLLEILDALDSAKRPLLLKCSGGQDRTSFAAGLYLLHTRGWPALAEAEAQFARWPYLHMPKRQQQWLRMFPAFAAERAGGKMLRDWIATSYSPEDFKGWLTTRGRGDSFRGIQQPRTRVTNERHAD